MDLKELIGIENCLILGSTTKTEALMEMIENVKSQGAINDTEGLVREIFYREQLMSTGIGQGLAIPHVRFAGISEPVIFVGTSPDGIRDYEALDDQPVHTVVMILVGADQHKEYLRILSILVHRLKEERVRSALPEAQDGGSIYRILTGREL